MDDGSGDVARLSTEEEVAVGSSSVRSVIISAIHLDPHLHSHLHSILLMYVFWTYPRGSPTTKNEISTLSASFKISSASSSTISLVAVMTGRS